MCLHSKTNIPSIAEKDIVCYKVAELIDSNTCQTPFRLCNLPLNKLIVNEDKEGVYFMLGFRSFYCIGGGFFHASLTKDAAKYMLGDLYGPYRIFKCIIPKGSKYFLGINEDICANQIIIDYECIESN